MTPDTITPELLAAARGDAPAGLLLADARIVNVFTGEVLRGDIAVHGSRIAAVGEGLSSGAAERVDLKGAFVAPGLIDAHMHVESTMLPPTGFASLALPHGTTGAVLDPHEIANVLGLPGIRFLMDNAEGAPFSAMWAASSCVPSCHLETSGATLTADDLAPLFDDERVVALAEMMNFPGVVHADAGVLRKVNLGLARRIVDGHCPGLRGRALQAYAAAGISSDHESTGIDEAREKLRAGMQVFIREGSAARNLGALLPLVMELPHALSRFCFCTDDRHPADLRDEGHIDHIVRKAIGLGLDPVRAITIGSLNTARHYRIRDMGAVAPGYRADLIVCEDLREFRPRLVYRHGNLVAREGAYLGPTPSVGAYPAAPVRLPAGIGVESFAIRCAEGARVRVIGMDPHQLVTEHLVEPALVRDGRAVADPSRDMLKLAVIERHHGTGNLGLGFVRGFGFRSGALASTVGHDAHNLAVVGDNEPDMLAAARALAEAGGGQCVVSGGRVLAMLPLPIAGLMSDQPAETVIAQQAGLLGAARTLGCPHDDPFMPLSFMPLPVIPSLKLSDMGLVDVDRFEIVPLIA